jgi:hypothetical protein
MESACQAHLQPVVPSLSSYDPTPSSYAAPPGSSSYLCTTPRTPPLTGSALPCRRWRLRLRGGLNWNQATSNYTWALQPEKNTLARVRPKMVFLAILQNKMHGRPPKPGLCPGRKLGPDAPSGMVMGRIFSTRNNRVFSARAEPDLARKMLISTSNQGQIQYF